MAQVQLENVSLKYSDLNILDDTVIIYANATILGGSTVCRANRDTKLSAVCWKKKDGAAGEWFIACVIGLSPDRGIGEHPSPLSTVTSVA